jgi:RNA polymerase sigma-70 factor, ECF subfamily
MSEVRKHIVNKLTMLRARAIRLLRDTQGADDLVQQTVEAALKNENQFQPGSNLDAWLMTIMKNTFLNDRRRVKVENLFMLKEDMPDLAVEMDPNGGLRLREAAAIMEAMAKDQVTTLLELVVNNKSYKEVSRDMGIPMGTVKSRINRAREQLLEAAGDY